MEKFLQSLVHGGGDSIFETKGTSLVAQTIKNLPAMQETWVQSLSQDDCLEKGTATHSSILAWRIPYTKEPGRLQSMGLQRAGHDLATNTFTFSLFKSSLAQKESLNLWRHADLGLNYRFST